MKLHLHYFDDHEEGEGEGDDDEEQGADGEEEGADAGALLAGWGRYVNVPALTDGLLAPRLLLGPLVAPQAGKHLRGGPVVHVGVGGDQGDRLLGVGRWCTALVSGLTE